MFGLGLLRIIWHIAAVAKTVQACVLLLALRLSPFAPSTTMLSQSSCACITLCHAVADLTPAAHRATASHAKALNPVIEPCLAEPLAAALAQIQRIFPPAAACMAATAAAAAAGGSGSSSGFGSAQPQQQQAMVKLVNTRSGAGGSNMARQLLQMARPRLLLAGPAGSGQQQLGAAVLAALEGLPVHCIGLTSLLANVAARCG